MTRAELETAVIAHTVAGTLVWEPDGDQRWSVARRKLTLVLDGNRLHIERGGKSFRIVSDALLAAVQSAAGENVPNWLSSELE